MLSKAARFHPFSWLTVHCVCPYTYIYIFTHQSVSGNVGCFHFLATVNTFKIRFIILSAAKDGEAPYSQQKQDWKLTEAQIIAKFRLKLKKVGKTTRLVMYDLIQSLTITQWK